MPPFRPRCRARDRPARLIAKPALAGPAPLVFLAGDTIHAQGDAALRLFRVLSGAVRTCRFEADGRRHIVAFNLPGDVFGFATDGLHQFDAEAICHTMLHPLPMAGEPGGKAERMEGALRSLHQTREHLIVLARQSAMARIAAFLIDMAQRQPGAAICNLPMSRADIGDYLGLTMETVSRLISQLRAQGIIQQASRRSFKIMRPVALKAAMDGRLPDRCARS
ncbi:MAG: helix-turn-helix domain-containing protein [Phyllobacteriaceae bacterium]|nr:helix-turn-helix domain-containing protein [Phyllobacteriaceae bacterium]